MDLSETRLRFKNARADASARYFSPRKAPWRNASNSLGWSATLQDAKDDQRGHLLLMAID